MQRNHTVSDLKLKIPNSVRLSHTKTTHITSPKIITRTVAGVSLTDTCVLF